MKTFLITVLSLLTIGKQSRVVFDIPALKNKSIVELRKILGKPEIDDVPLDYKNKSGVNGDAYFKKGDFVLEVTYNPLNNKVNDFFIAKEHSVSDYKMLEIAGNVLNSEEFILSPVRSGKDPNMFTGVTVTPK